MEGGNVLHHIIKKFEIKHKNGTITELRRKCYFGDGEGKGR